MSRNILKIFIVLAILLGISIPLVYADIYINVLAVNGSTVDKNSPIKFDLPGELTADDILDTNGLQLDYNVDDADYYVYGDVSLKPKESKTFRIRVKDKWEVSPQQVVDLKKQIEEGYVRLGKVHDEAKALILKNNLINKIDYIVNLQNTDQDSIEKRIDAYRAYAKEIKRIQNDALDRDYWRSDPDDVETPKLIHLTIEVSNPSKLLKPFKHKDYLPEEVKPEDVIEAEGFEVRYDEVKQLSFLFKEEDLSPGEKKKYSIGILDIWSIKKKDINYLRSRAQYVSDYLKDTRFEESAKFLTDRIASSLNLIDASQAKQQTTLEHISAFRDNKNKYNDAEHDVETLEKLLAVFREDLEKSKVENILTKIQALKGVGDVSKVMFNKKFEQSSAWGYITWILIFVGLLTLANFVIWLIRSKDKKLNEKNKLNEENDSKEDK